MKEITAAELKLYRQQENLTQEELGKMIGLGKSPIAKIESGDRLIGPAEQRLLQLLIHGVQPFAAPGISNEKSKDNLIDFLPEEWRLIQVLAQREGYSDGKEWLIAKIRTYLAMQKTTQTHDKLVAEPAQSGYGKKKTRRPSKFDTIPNKKKTS